MKLIKFSNLSTLTLYIFSIILISSCQKINQSPEGCVVAFIVSAEERNMAKAWEMLSPEVQAYYNSQGEKMRKSGKGALENEIAKITKFRSVKKDYLVQPEDTVPGRVKIVSVGGPEHIIETINVDGNYKIKDIASLKNLFEGISAEIKKENSY